MRASVLAALLLLACAPRGAAADAAALAAKDREIAALKAEIARLQAEVQRLTAQVQQLAPGATSPAPSPLPAPTYPDLNAGQETSREQMKYLLYLFRALKPSAGQAQYPALDGKNFVLWLVAVGQLEKDNEGPLAMLFSPADRRLKFPGLAGYAALSAASLQAQRFPALTSYAGRRNAARDLAITPASPAATTALLADLSFSDGVLVGFLDGKVRYLNRRDLGLAPTDPIVAGPTSRSPVLQTLSSD